MTIGIYNPFFESLGGGERYTLTLASHWSRMHTVYLFWREPILLTKAQDRLHLDLSRVKTAENIFQSKNLLYKLKETKRYDLIFILSDGSIPTSMARANILHFQTPFQRIPYNPLKLWRYNAVVCNSFFTKKYLDPRLGSRSCVIYPPVRAFPAAHSVKAKLILTVGRFTSYFQAKKQEVLIEAFKEGYTQGLLKDWKLVLVGGLLEGDRQYFQKLYDGAKGFPISLIPNGTFGRLQSLYQRASVYWHAAGFGETDPKLAEHFGISTVEAMSAGCIPIVYNGGGQPEIVKEGINGFLWETIDELLDKTKTVTSDTILGDKIRLAAQRRAKSFDERVFCQAFDKLIDRIVK